MQDYGRKPLFKQSKWTGRFYALFARHINDNNLINGVRI